METNIHLQKQSTNKENIMQQKIYSPKAKLMFRIIASLAISILVLSNGIYIFQHGIDELLKNGTHLLQYLEALIVTVLLILVVIFPQRIAILFTYCFLLCSKYNNYRPNKQHGNDDVFFMHHVIKSTWVLQQK